MEQLREKYDTPEVRDILDSLRCVELAAEQLPINREFTRDQPRCPGRTYLHTVVDTYSGSVGDLHVAVERHTRHYAGTVDGRRVDSQDVFYKFYANNGVVIDNRLQNDFDELARQYALQQSPWRRRLQSLRDLFQRK